MWLGLRLSVRLWELSVRLREVSVSGGSTVFPFKSAKKMKFKHVIELAL